MHSWTNKRRVQDLAISPDGQRLITISPEKQISVYNFLTWEEEYTMQFKMDLTCVNISRDSKYMLINMAEELQLIDINNPTETVRRFHGQRQGEWIIRGCFGGVDENLVISGSEGMPSFWLQWPLIDNPADSKVHIWHKENGTLIETLSGHSSGCVSCVAWNPADTCMFASAGDDKKVKM